MKLSVGRVNWDVVGLVADFSGSTTRSQAPIDGLRAVVAGALFLPRRVPVPS